MEALSERTSSMRAFQKNIRKYSSYRAMALVASYWTSSSVDNS